MDINYFLSRLCATMKLAGQARSDFDLKRIFHHSGRWSMNPSHSPCLLVFAAMECDGSECGDDFCVVFLAKLNWDAVGLTTHVVALRKLNFETK